MKTLLGRIFFTATALMLLAGTCEATKLGSLLGVKRGVLSKKSVVSKPVTKGIPINIIGGGVPTPISKTTGLPWPLGKTSSSSGSFGKGGSSGGTTTCNCPVTVTPSGGMGGSLSPSSIALNLTLNITINVNINIDVNVCPPATASPSQCVCIGW